MATPIPNNYPSLRRTSQPSGSSTFTSSFSFAPRQRPMMAPNRNAQCTHLTMTRLYTNEFRCGVCFRLSTTGWVYRCTQDRELLIEDDAERSEVDKMDTVCDLFPLSSVARKRSAAARAIPYSFLEEVNDDALKTYTPAQLSRILQQRANVLDAANAIFSPSSDDENYYSNHSNPSTSSSPISQTTAPSRPATDFSEKPWLPPKETECQFKCCHLCRPTLTERAFLSLDGIVNDDIPATAIYGFGFHLHARKRPVALVKHVKNLGLRPSPAARPEDVLINPVQSRFLYLSAQLAVKQQGLGLGLGLGPLDPTAGRPLPSIPIILPTTSPLTQLTHSLASLPLQNPRAFPLQNRPSLSAPQISPVIAIPASGPHQSYISPYSSPARSILQRRLELASSNVAILTPLPDQTDEEVDVIAAPLTPMERSEMSGAFGKLSLDVRGGVAVTEEAVGGHFADVITQV